MKRRFPPQALSRYLGGGHHRIQGWLYDADAQLIEAIGAIQSANGFSGSVGEIGVHHGRLFILLYLMLHDGENAFCVDVFENQQLNVDLSGAGNREIFISNVILFAAGAADISIITSDSQLVSSTNITDEIGPVRLFSIDGAHTMQATHSDLGLAVDSLADSGVIIVDDCFNADWPGVSDGLHTFFSQRPRELAVFAIGYNKVFLCRPAMASLYKQGLYSRAHPLFKKASEMLGCEVDLYTNGYVIASLSRTWRSRLFSKLSRSLKRRTQWVRWRTDYRMPRAL